MPRALALDREIVLFDEPTSALDPVISLTIEEARSKRPSSG